MSSKVIVAFAVLAVVVFAFVAGAVYGASYLIDRYTLPIGELHAEEHSVPAAGIEQAAIDIVFGLGELKLAAAESDGMPDQELMHLKLLSNLDGASAIISQTVTAEGAAVMVEQAVPMGVPDPRRSAEFRNEWDMGLAGEIPMELDLVLGLGESMLDLRRLTLTKLVVASGAGSTTVDLRHAYQSGFSAELVGGLGDMTVLLPDQVGIVAAVTSGMGDVTVRGLIRDQAQADEAERVYLNTAYGESPVTIDLTVVAGLGSVNLVVGDAGVNEGFEPRE